MPTIALTKLPPDLSNKLLGHYFGWARLVRDDTRSGKSTIDGDESWYQAILSAIPMDVVQLSRASINEASKKNFKIRLIHDLEDRSEERTSLEVQIMGFIRPDEPSQRAALMKGLELGDEAAMEAAMLAEVNDVSMAQSILDQPNWSHEAANAALQARSEKPRGLERVMSGYADSRMAVSRQAERVPLQKMGIRMPLDSMKEKTIIANGFYVRR